MNTNQPESYSSPLIKALLERRNPIVSQQTEENMLTSARIEDALKQKGWTGKDLAQAMGVSPSVVSKWLSGTHHFASSTLDKIHACLILKSE